MQRVVFNTTALRLLEVWTLADVGTTMAVDSENGYTYMVAAAGSGAACFAPFVKKALHQKVVQGTGLMSLRVVDANSDEGAIAVVIGGLLTSDSSPAIQANATKNRQQIVWATGNVAPVGGQYVLPEDFDGTRDVTIEFESASGATDDFAMTVATTWDDGSEIADTAAEVGKSATVHTNSATIAAADIPDNPKHLSVRFTPAAAHAANTYILQGFRILYYPKA